MPRTPQPFCLPMYAVHGLYTEEASRVLAQICTPFEQAKEGDVLAIFQEVFDREQHGLHPLPITGMVAMINHEGTVRPAYVPFSDASEHNKPNIAMACMTLQTTGFDIHSLLQHMREMRIYTGEDFYATVVMLPHLVVMVTDEYQHNVLDDYFDEQPREQQQIAHCVRAIIPRKPTSNHIRVTMPSLLQDALAFINALAPILDEEGQTVPLTLPPTAAIMQAL